MTSTAIYARFTHLAITCDLTGRQMQLWLRLYELISHRQEVQLHTGMLLQVLGISRSQFLRVRKALVDHGFLSIRQDPQQHTSYTLMLDGKEIASTSMDEAATAKPLPDTAEVRQALAQPLAQNPQQPAATVLPEQAEIAAWTKSSKSSDLPGKSVYIPTPLLDAAAFGYIKTPDKGQQEALEEQTSKKGKVFRIDDEDLSCKEVIFNRQYEQELKLFCQAYPSLELHAVLQQWAEMRAQNGW